MQYEETLSYLYTRLPLFSRVGDAAIKKDLSNTLALCAALGNPQNKFKSVHIAGTNGKGSTSNMLAGILQQAGYKTGLYTSPHLLDFRERIRVGGAMITKDDVVNFVDKQRELIETLQPSFFEVTVAMAFHHFAQQQVDIAIIETGLGGRLDSTNIITPILSVITNISLDHTHMLGNTLTAIAQEKAGIIKPTIPVIIGEKNPDTVQVFLDKATDTQSKIIFAEDEWQVSTAGKDDEYLSLHIQEQDRSTSSNPEPSDADQPSPADLLDIHVQLDLPGSYQQKNIKTTLSAVKELNTQGYQLSEKDIKSALSQIKTLTGLMGRWQTLRRAPQVICDTGHNEAGWKEVLENLRSSQYEQLHMVIGIMKDKDAAALFSLLPTEARYYFCHAGFERALPANELEKLSRTTPLQGNAFPSVREAVTAALAQANKNDLIFIGGSTFIVAEALELFI